MTVMSDFATHKNKILSLQLNLMVTSAAPPTNLCHCKQAKNILPLLQDILFIRVTHKRMRLTAKFCCLFTGLSVLTTGYAYGQTNPDNKTLQIAVVAPFEGPYAILAQQIRLGTEAAKLQNQYSVSLVYMQEYCKADQDAATAEKIRQAGIKYVIGYLCSELLEGAAPVLVKDGIAILSLGSRQPTLLEQENRQNLNIFRLYPDRKRAVDKLAEKLAAEWQKLPFALLEDGTVQGRDFARTALQAFKARGLEPALIDTYRPAQTSQNTLIAQLKRAGINHVLLGGEGEDATVIARSAAAANWPLTIAGTESLLGRDPQSPLPAGLLMSGLPDMISSPAAENAVKAITALAKKQQDTGDMLADGYALPAYSAVQIVAQAQADQSNPPKQPVEILRSTQFETVIGEVSFSPEGLRKQNPYQLMRYNGKDFEPIE